MGDHKSAESLVNTRACDLGRGETDVIDVLTEVVQLGEEFWYNALPVGKFHDSRYGPIDITPTLVSQLAASFGKATPYPLPVKLGHGDGAPSPGTIKSVRAESDGLHIQFALDDEAAKEVKARRFRFMSAEYSPDYTNKETGEKMGPALLGVALVNQPAHPGVRPIVFSDGTWQQQTEEVVSVDEAKLKELEVKLAEAEAEKLRIGQERDALKKQADNAVADLNKMRAEQRADQIKVFCDEFVKQGVPPALVDKIRPVLFADTGMIKLADNTEVSLQQVFKDIFTEIPKIQLSAIGTQAAQNGRDTLISEQVNRVAEKLNGQKE